MEDFNSYVKNGGGKNSSDTPDKNLTDLITQLAGKYDGASEKELMQAIIREAEKGKRNGTLSNADIDRFASMLAPMLDSGKRMYLKKVVAELKKI